MKKLSLISATVMGLTLFSSAPAVAQIVCPVGLHPARTGAVEVDTLGYTFFGDSVYRLAFVVPHTSGDITFNLSASGLEPNIFNESWGVDNVRVRVDSSVFYTNDFEGAVGPEWSPAITDVTPVGARRFLGQFNNGTVSLSLQGLPAHNFVTIELDLFIIQSWDGSNQEFGPDKWQLSIAGGPTLLDATFSNALKEGYCQSYPVPHGGEGCTPGYWKQPHHFDSWVGYAPTNLFAAIFGSAPSGASANLTLLGALQLKGGQGLALARHAAAALLNSTHPVVDYPFSTSQVVSAYNAARAAGDWEYFVDFNEAGCPLD